jgi:hypothetical protein
MEVYEIAYLFLGFATLVAAGTIINYSRKRSAATSDPEIKRAFWPLYLFGFGLIIFGIGAMLTFLILSGLLSVFPTTSFVFLYHPYVNDYYAYYVFTLIELIFLSIASGIILRQRLITVFMVVMIVAAFLLMFNAILTIQAYRISTVADLFINFGNILSILILAANAMLFLWIAYDTRRSTSWALGYAMIVQILAVPRLYEYLLSLGLDIVVLAITVLALMGPAMIAFAFLRPEQKISAELLGYGASFAGPVVVFGSLLATGLIANPLVVGLAVLGAIAIALAAGTASYTYGRWRETRQLPTALLMVIFASLTAGQVIGMLGSFQATLGVWTVYFDFIATSFALAVFTTVAILAAGYRTAASLPFFIYLPTVILIAQQYDAPISEAFLTYYYLGFPVMALFFVPVILFASAWRRMSKAGSPGRMRPLGMSIGLLIYIAIRFTFLLLEFPFLDPGYGLVVVGYAVLWLSITGRLDRM